MRNKVALITGGTGDIGTAICRYLYSQGAQVIAADVLDEERANTWRLQQEQADFDLHTTYVDITDDPSCRAMVDNVLSQFGAIDILVNNAGINRDAMFRKMQQEQWRTVIETDLNGVFNVTHNIINSMLESNYGRIINVSSVSAQKGQFGQTNYAAAKAGIHGFTKSLAQEVARKGITVNTVSPGYIDTKMVMNIREDIRQDIIEQIPVGRLGKPDEIAWAVGFLAAERSGFITGSNLSINGGLHMY